MAADYFDFSVYLDADENDVEQWYVERFSVLQRTVFQRPTSYFHHFKDLRPAEVKKTGQGIWRSINLPNLLQNVQPTRERASVILHKGSIARGEGSAVATFNQSMMSKAAPIARIKRRDVDGPRKWADQGPSLPSM